MERMSDSYDAVIVGAGPNGLAAAITLAQAGRRVRLIEGAPTIGGGCRSAALTLPGFVHDVCSAIHPLAVSSPFFRTMPLEQHGVTWIHSPAAVAHPLDDGTAVLIGRDLAASSETMGVDAAAYRRLMEPLARSWTDLTEDILGPLRIPPRHPLALARFGSMAALPATVLARLAFRGERARAAMAGLAAHSILPLEAPLSAAFSLVLGASAHAVGWPMPRGGAQRISDALGDILRGLGGEIATGLWVKTLDDLPPTRAVLLDVTPRQLVAMAANQLTAEYRRQLGRFRNGPGVFKIDYALSEPIPWRAAACRQAATVHVGGTLDEIATSERAPWQGKHAARPFVLLVQHTLFDPTRAPPGQHTAWAYCHVPHGSSRDVTTEIEAQIERFAPGFRDCILARRTMNCAAMEAYNPNYIGGDIIGGAQDLWQTFTRPTFSLRPYETSAPGLYLCSSSTPPGGGVHGMAGYHAARVALRRLEAGR